jgi:hypothetical protein
MLKYNILSICDRPHIIGSKSICEQKLHNFGLTEFSFWYPQLIQVYRTYIKYIFRIFPVSRVAFRQE